MARMTVRARLVTAALLVGYAVLVAVVLSEHSPSIAAAVVGRVEGWLETVGAPAVMTASGRVEFLLNALMFVPLAFLAALTFPRHPWASWVVYAFVFAGAVELLQGLFLPSRSAQFADLVGNTLGALVGAVLSVAFNLFLRAVSGHRDGDPSERPARPGHVATPHS